MQIRSAKQTKRVIKKEPRFDVFEGQECSVSRRITHHLHLSGSSGDSRVAVASKESEDLNKPRGVKTLLSGLLVEVSVLAKILSRRK